MAPGRFRKTRGVFGNLLGKAVKGAIGAVKTIAGGVKKVGGAIKKGAQFVNDHKETITNAANKLGLGNAASKLTTAATNITNKYGSNTPTAAQATKTAA